MVYHIWIIYHIRYTASGEPYISPNIVGNAGIKSISRIFLSRNRADTKESKMKAAMPRLSPPWRRPARTRCLPGQASALRDALRTRFSRARGSRPTGGGQQRRTRTRRTRHFDAQSPPRCWDLGVLVVSVTRQSSATPRDNGDNGNGDGGCDERGAGSRANLHST